MTTSSTRVVTLNGAVALLTRAHFLEVLRRREFYALLLLMGLYLVGALLVRIVGVEDPATGAFVLNLGLSLAFFFGHLMALLFAVRALPDEIEARTIYPVLAKPVARHHFILGKWFAAWVAGVFTTFTLLLLCWLPAPYVAGLSPATFAQAVMLQMASLAMLAAMGILLSVWWPKSVNIVVLVLLLLAGHRISAAVRGHLPETTLGQCIDWIVRYIPDFGILNLVDRYTDGIPPLPTLDVALRLGYAVIVSAFCLGWACYGFYKRGL
ncbi:MAG: ABC transporter permease [Candidatus Sumerlaeaceae bacterium]